MNEAKEYTLPSGLKVKLRKLGNVGRTKVIGALPFLDVEAELKKNPDVVGPAAAAKVLETQTVWVCACCVEPKLTANPDGEPGRQFIDDVMDQADFDAAYKIVQELNDTGEGVRPLPGTATT